MFRDIFSFKRIFIVFPPTWITVNHHAIFEGVGLGVETYPYYNPITNRLDFSRLLTAFGNVPNGSVMVLHACAHNPTGVDPTRDQWNAIADVMVEKGHFAFFDCAYQGFASGDLDEDAWSVREFARRGIPMLVCQVGHFVLASWLQSFTERLLTGPLSGCQSTELLEKCRTVCGARRRAACRLSNARLHV